jgi:hypothetical protein
MPARGDYAARERSDRHNASCPMRRLKNRIPQCAASLPRALSGRGNHHACQQEEDGWAAPAHVHRHPAVRCGLSATAGPALKAMRANIDAVRIRSTRPTARIGFPLEPHGVESPDGGPAIWSKAIWDGVSPEAFAAVIRAVPTAP